MNIKKVSKVSQLAILVAIVAILSVMAGVYYGVGPAISTFIWGLIYISVLGGQVGWLINNSKRERLVVQGGRIDSIAGGYSGAGIKVNNNSKSIMKNNDSTVGNHRNGAKKRKG